MLVRRVQRVLASCVGMGGRGASFSSGERSDVVLVLCCLFGSSPIGQQVVVTPEYSTWAGGEDDER